MSYIVLIISFTLPLFGKISNTIDFLIIRNFCFCSKLKREGVKILSQMENLVKGSTVHVISVLLFARLVCLLLSAQRRLITVNCIQ